jgi:hypothetical protein
MEALILAFVNDLNILKPVYGMQNHLDSVTINE